MGGGEIMKKIFLLLSMYLASCAGGPVKDTFQMKPFNEQILPNGLHVIYVADAGLPRVSLQLLIKAGTISEGEDQQGLNYLTAQLLEQGTKKRSADQIADDLGQIASDLSIGPGADYTLISTSSLSPNKEILLDVFSDVIINPAFQPPEIERLRSQQLAAIGRISDQPSAYADLLIDKDVFGGHPYSHPAIGTEQTVKGFSRDQIIKHFLRFYRPNNAILAVTGNFDAAFIQQVNMNKSMSSWKKQEVKPMKTASTAEKPNESISLYSKAGLQQSEIRFSHLGIKRSEADYLSLRIASLILGGTFASRLNQRVRDDLGLTYSIHSNSDARLDRGAFEISTFSRNEKVAETILETKQVLKAFVEGGATGEELQSAKALLLGQFPMAIETTDKLAFNLMILRFYGIADDYLTKFNSHVEKISLKQVNEVIKNRIHPGKMNIIIYADAKQLTEELKPLGSVKIEQIK
jgi:zinc protease